MLRGKHETRAINRIYGFYDECKVHQSIRIWKLFNDCFNCLPFVATIDKKIFCIHSGLSPDLKSIEQIICTVRPTDIPDSGLLCDILWAIPAENGEKGWHEPDTGVSLNFGEDVVESFLRRHDFELMVRSHQVIEFGFEFYGNKKMVTVFSAPNYSDFENVGAIMIVDETLSYSLKTFIPRPELENNSNE